MKVIVRNPKVSPELRRQLDRGLIPGAYMAVVNFLRALHQGKEYAFEQPYRMGPLIPYVASGTPERQAYIALPVHVVRTRVRFEVPKERCRNDVERQMRSIHYRIVMQSRFNELHRIVLEGTING